MSDWFYFRDTLVCKKFVQFISMEESAKSVSTPTPKGAWKIETMSVIGIGLAINGGLLIEWFEVEREYLERRKEVLEILGIEDPPLRSVK